MTKEQSLRERAYKYLKGRPGVWINGGEMERLAIAAGYKGSTVSRELRRLAEDSRSEELDGGGFVQNEEKDGARVRSVWYRWIAVKDAAAERQQMLQENRERVRREFP
jgi:hypothetical protein